MLARSDLIRLPSQAYQQLESIQQINPVDMYPSLDSLNQLASIAWKVNQTVLDIILSVFNSGGSKKLDVPQPSSALLPLEEIDPKSEKATNMSKTERYNYFRLKLMHRRKQQEMHSMWCDTLYRLSLANHVRKSYLICKLLFSFNQNVISSSVRKFSGFRTTWTFEVAYTQSLLI